MSADLSLWISHVCGGGICMVDELLMFYYEDDSRSEFLGFGKKEI